MDKSEAETSGVTEHHVHIKEESEAEIREYETNVLTPKDSFVETFVIIPPDGGWGWVVVLAAFFAYVTSDGLTYSFGVFIHDLSVHFHCTEGKITVASAVNMCIFSLSGPFAAALVNRFGFRIVSVAGSFISALAFVSAAIFNNVILLITFYGIIGGIGFGLIYISAIIAVSFYFERFRAIATGLAVCGAGIGSLALPPLITTLLETVGWRSTFRVIGVIMLLTVICGIAYRPITPTRVILSEKPNKPRARHSKILDMDSEEEDGRLIELHISTVDVYESEICVHSFSSHTRNSVVKEEEVGNMCTRCYKRGKRKLNIPIYKDDVFYSSSVATLRQYKDAERRRKSEDLQKYLGSKSNLEYQLAVTRIGTHEELLETKKFMACRQSCKHMIALMLNIEIFTSLPYCLLLINTITVSLGIYGPYLFINDILIQNGISKDTAYWFVSAIGLANTVGRLACGVLSNLPKLKAIVLTYILLFIGGIATICAPFCYHIWYQLAYCGIFGFSIASLSVLRTIIVVDMVGLERLSNGMGMMLMCQGLGTLVGIVFSGYLNDVSGDMKWSFYFGGTCITISAAVLVSAHLLSIARPHPESHAHYQIA